MKKSSFLNEKNKTIIVVLLLIATLFVPLVGILRVVLMWFWMKWSKWIKALITLPFVVIFVIFPLLIGSYLFVARPFQVAGDAMAPTHPDGQFLVTKPVSPSKEVMRGDVMILKSPQDDNIMLIKRVVGMPNERVMIMDGQVYINGELLDEKDYIGEGISTEASKYLVEGEEMTVPASSYFVLGDNRPKSMDSRAYGFVPRDNMVSEISFCYWNCK